ncbi:RNA-directed DNA polymerase, eukaryota, reverse transcriptase zinc-binding domain protein [Tanacetum coccineum]|uniref:RNA-directed DNA polymerase, eukaryota, reverse transcriptase zinc-binding domain protein n=1 Tax=Tanacetum coccineum TaxID=301880 RepID=A0ABQ5ITY0_9ASTR
MTCLSTASFSVCVNGESHGFFSAKRGLRQGDPISPYLFTLVMEVLNLMVKRQVRNDRRFKYHSGCQKLGITSLFFVDDLLILCHGDMVSAFILRSGLDEFCMSSGLYPSMRGLDINAKVINLIDNGSWCWTIDWVGEYDEVLDVPVPMLNDNFEDRTVWINKKGKEKKFSVNKVWKAIRIEYPKVNIGAAIYYLWQKRNIRRVELKERSADVLFKVVVESVRLKLIGLTLKCSPSVVHASKILPISDCSIGRFWDNCFNFGIDIWDCNMIYGLRSKDQTKYSDVTYNVSGLACFGIVMVGFVPDLMFMLQIRSGLFAGFKMPIVVWIVYGDVSSNIDWSQYLLDDSEVYCSSPCMLALSS